MMTPLSEHAVYIENLDVYSNGTQKHANAEGEEMASGR
jgi:hypothetical protein